MILLRSRSYWLGLILAVPCLAARGLYPRPQVRHGNGPAGFIHLAPVLAQVHCAPAGRRVSGWRARDAAKLLPRYERGRLLCERAASLRAGALRGRSPPSKRLAPSAATT